MFFMAAHKTIRASDLTPESCKSATILDVRTNKEHADACLDLPHIHIPMDESHPESLVHDHGLAKDAKLYILCLAGKRAVAVASQLTKAGYTDVHVIEGGLMGCQACGQTIKKG